MERAIETQRLRLFRLVAGLLGAVGFLSVGPVSRGFSAWVCGHVGSILSRAELAARYLVIAQARVIAARRGNALDVSRFSQALAVADGSPEDAPSVAECRARLWALRAVLMNLSRYASHLLRRMDRAVRDAVRAGSPWPGSVAQADRRRSAPLHNWSLVCARIERPPEHPPPV